MSGRIGQYAPPSGHAGALESGASSRWSSQRGALLQIAAARITRPCLLSFPLRVCRTSDAAARERLGALPVFVMALQVGAARPCP